jgi:hypothetical protein
MCVFLRILLKLALQNKLLGNSLILAGFALEIL